MYSQSKQRWEKGREKREQGDKIEGGFSYSVFQSPQTYPGSKRSIYFVKKRKQRRKN